MSTLSPAELDALIDELTVDCYNDEEQLTGLLTGAEEALVIGEVATIAGAEIRIMAVDSPSDMRRDLTAVCERDGHRFELSLADIRFGMPPSLGGSLVRATAGLVAVRIPVPANRTCTARLQSEG